MPGNLPCKCRGHGDCGFQARQAWCFFLQRVLTLILIYQSTLPNSIGLFSWILRVRENSPQNLMSSNRNPISLAFGGSCHLCRWSAQSVPRFRKRCHGKVWNKISWSGRGRILKKWGGFWGWDGGGHPQRILQHPQVTSVTLDMLPSANPLRIPKDSVLGVPGYRLSHGAEFFHELPSHHCWWRKNHSEKNSYFSVFFWKSFWKCHTFWWSLLFDIFLYWGKIRIFMALVSTNIHWDVVCSRVWQMWDNDWLRIPGWVVSSIFYFHPENWGRFPILTIQYFSAPTRYCFACCRWQLLHACGAEPNRYEARDLEDF